MAVARFFVDLDHHGTWRKMERKGGSAVLIGSGRI
jgi:hypothetical protein